ncbi:2-phospho-L-lactate guanylyltransferase [Natronosalvus vescus]|uniref:2-phospho-L-lactate guanylyltransferase n=1 Tax=Natronosalvus vescus TaxID=2953881 RepID=UPI002091989F|nr:2-phospho-L-lactate guanylyltransferase [Natronosalvus vescus]
MHVVVPFAGETPKSRLAPALESTERREFARAMLADVCTAIQETGREPTILSTEPLSASVLESIPGTVEVDDQSLSVAVNAILESTDGPVAVVMADLPLVTPAVLKRLFDAVGDVIVAPGRGGGTNALVVRHPEFRTDYHGASYLDHQKIAREVGATLETIDSFRLSTDIDEPDDLVEVWLHGGERSRTALEQFGFGLETTAGRVRLVRTD